MIVTRSDLARILAISDDMLDKLIANGMPVAERHQADSDTARTVKMSFDIFVAVPWYLTALRSQHQLDMNEILAESEKLETEKLRFEVGIKRIELAMKAGVAMTVQEAVDHYVFCVASCRSQLLSLPPKLAGELSSAQDVHAAHALLKSALEAILGDLERELLALPVAVRERRASLLPDDGGRAPVLPAEVPGSASDLASTGADYSNGMG